MVLKLCFTSIQVAAKTLHESEQWVWRTSQAQFELQTSRERELTPFKLVIFRAPHLWARGVVDAIFRENQFQGYEVDCVSVYQEADTSLTANLLLNEKWEWGDFIPFPTNPSSCGRWDWNQHVPPQNTEWFDGSGNQLTQAERQADEGQANEGQADGQQADQADEDRVRRWVD